MLSADYGSQYELLAVILITHGTGCGWDPTLRTSNGYSWTVVSAQTKHSDRDCHLRKRSGRGHVSTHDQAANRPIESVRHHAALEPELIFRFSRLHAHHRRTQWRAHDHSVSYRAMPAAAPGSAAVEVFDQSMEGVALRMPRGRLRPGRPEVSPNVSTPPSIT